jgi:two-component system sensor histidine kinase ArlS
MKIRYKIAMVFMLLTALIMLVLCIIIYYNSRSQQQRDFAKRLQNRALTVGSLYDKSVSGDSTLLSRVDSATFNRLGAEMVNIYNDANENVYSFSRHHIGIKEVSPAIIQRAFKEGMVVEDDGDHKLLALHYQPSKFPTVVAISATDPAGELNLKELRQSLVSGFFAAILLSFFVGWFFSRSILLPLKDISHTVNALSATNIQKRLNTGKVKDEWEELKDTFNKLLGRLQESFEIQGRFIANASHELSTPLTSISSQIEVAMSKARTEEEYRRVLQSVQTDVVQLGVLTQHLLDIARTARGGSIQTSLVRMDELVMELPSVIRRESSDYTIKVFFQELPENELHCQVSGNYELLLSACRNMALNGCKYSPDHTVNIELSFVNNNVILQLSNISEQIDPSELATFFQPFQRGSNAADIEGHGLGLSLSRRIVLLHNGELKADYADHIITISVILPSAAKRTELTIA